MKLNIKKLLEISAKYKFGHIPSSLSMYKYLRYILPVIKKDFNIVIGKPFGAQAYYTIWEEMGYIDNISELSYGVKHNELDFVSYGEETLGNALGIAYGFSIFQEKPIWCNISDGALGMGPTLEAVVNTQYFKPKLKAPILLTIDVNQQTSLDKTPFDIPAMIKLFESNGWLTYSYDMTLVFKDHSYPIKNIIDNIKKGIGNKLTVIFFKTQKGYGVKEMVDESITNHYKVYDEDEIKKLTILDKS